MRLSKCISARRAAALGRAAFPFGPVLGLLLAILLTGCASQSQYEEGSWYGDPRVAMEDDGLPAQTPPLRRTKTGPDDPSEPFSPNYGPPPLPSQHRSPAPTLPADLPPAFRRQIASASNFS